MSIQHLSRADIAILENPGKRSEQLVWPANAPEARATITRVTMAPGAVSGLHRHARSEQIWIIESGVGELLSAGEETSALQAGDIVRTPVGAPHGVRNTGADPLVYLSVTTPPEDFSGYYRDKRDA